MIHTVAAAAEMWAPYEGCPWVIVRHNVTNALFRVVGADKRVMFERNTMEAAIADLRFFLTSAQEMLVAKGLQIEQALEGIG